MPLILSLTLTVGLLLVFLSATTRWAPVRAEPPRPSTIRAFLDRNGAGQVGGRDFVLLSSATGMALAVAGQLALGWAMVSAATFLLGVTLPAWYLTNRHQRERTTMQSALAEAVDSLRSAVRAGMSVEEALASLARNGPEVLRPPLTRPDLAFELRRLSAQGRIELEAERGQAGPSMFVSPTLERTLRPVLDDAGRLVGRLLARLGVRTADLEQRLAVGWPGMTPSQFFGQKLAVGLLFFACFPALNLAGLQPFGPWPIWTWLAGGFAGFVQPDWLLERRVSQRRQQVLMELPTLLDLLAMAASAGLSPEQALLDVSRQVKGVLGDGLRNVAREAGLGTMTHPEGLRALAAREGVQEIVSMADAWQSALEQGLPLGQVMLTLADTVRERKRTTLIAEGEKSSIRMLFPVTLFIFPVFLVVLLYPAGVQLLGLSD